MAPVIQPPPPGDPPGGYPVERPVFVVVQEGSVTNPSVRFVGKVGAQTINLPSSDPAKATAAAERLLRTMLPGATKGLKAEEADPPSEPSEVLTALRTLLDETRALRADVAGLKDSIEKATEVTPPGPPMPPPADQPLQIWLQLIAQAEPPEFVKTPLAAYDRERALTYAWHGFSPINGTQVVFEPALSLRKELLAEIIQAADVDSLSPVAKRFYMALQDRGIGTDEGFYGVLSGRIAPMEWGLSFGSRPDAELMSVESKTLQQLVSDDLGGRQGGGPGFGGN